MSEPPAPLLQVEGLRVEFPSPGGVTPVVAGAAFSIAPGEVLGLVGASGAGKTMTVLALLGLVPRPGRIAAGRVLWRGADLVAASGATLRKVRGAGMGMVFQDAGAALHPSFRVLDQVSEAILAHHPRLPRRDADERALALLDRLGIPASQRRAAEFPHQWSGGMRQRALLAIALANRPALLLADEPTTGLDLTTQSQLLALLGEVRKESGTAMLLCTHDLGVIAELADRVAVMEHGRLVECASVADIFDRPVHPATVALLRAHGNGLVPGPRSSDHHAAPPALRVTDLRVAYPGRRSGMRHGPPIRAVDGVNFEIAAGETLGLVGESGCGKSTLARALVGLETAVAGRIEAGGRELAALRGDALRAARATIQLVFQDPFGSLNPRRRVADAIAHPLVLQQRGEPASRRARALELLVEVGLPADYGGRFPRELSGGERQRVAIARALATGPAVLVLDEAVSSLDTLAREGILTLLQRLQATSGFGCLFIAHDLEVVRRVAHRVAVMYLGRIVEVGDTETVYTRPSHPYTRALLSAAPVRHPRDRERARAAPLSGEVPDAADPPSGCRFRTRCPLAAPVCAASEPLLSSVGGDQASACHFSPKEGDGLQS